VLERFTGKAVMITIPTVFVLGAGASYPYGFPSGRGLKRALESSGDLFNVSADWHRGSENLPATDSLYPQSTLDDFSALLRKSPMSVDFFLNKHPDYEHIGKTAIASVILAQEKLQASGTIPTKDRVQDQWYSIVLEQMLANANANNYRDNRVTFVTFNYDRSLDFYMLSALVGSGLAGSLEDAEELALSTPVLHVYGMTGKLLGDESVPYGGGAHPYVQSSALGDRGDYVGLPDIARAAQAIYTMYEHRSTAELEKAIDALCSAERIVISGFGWDPYNTIALRPNEWVDNHRQILVTSMPQDSIQLRDQAKQVLGSKYVFHLSGTTKKLVETAVNLNLSPSEHPTDRPLGGVLLSAFEPIGSTINRLPESEYTFPVI
jgi:hypothetical protein